MKLVFSVILFLFLSLFFSCSQLDRRAHVVKVSNEVEEETLKINNAKRDVLQTKQDLRIALLELRFSQSQANKGKEVILDSRPFYIYSTVSGWDASALAQLHGKILPELYQLFRTINQLDLGLSVLCRNRLDCQLFKENMGPQLRKRTTFLYTHFLDYLGQREPLMVISPDEKLFDLLRERSPSWSDWRKSWFRLGKAQSLLGPEDWALLLPAVNEF